MVDDNGITPHTHSVNLEGNEGHHLMNTISGTSLSFCLFVAKWSSLNWWNTFNWYMFGDYRGYHLYSRLPALMTKVSTTTTHWMERIE